MRSSTTAGSETGNSEDDGVGKSGAELDVAKGYTFSSNTTSREM